MRLHLALCALFLTMILQAQTGDTTIYQTTAQMPRFPACESLDTTLAVKIQCADQELLRYVYRRVIYPPAAIEEGLEGTAVVAFVVEKDGSLSQPEILRDLGGGIGEAALVVVRAMQQDGILWVPGKTEKGEAVRTRVNLPVRFRLQDAPSFQMIGRDTVYIRFDEPLQYQGGSEALQGFLEERVRYPDSGNDSCIIGRIDVQVLVEPDGNVRILDMTDYNDLGFDFWYEAISAAIATRGKWIPAVFAGRKVPSSFDLTMSFLPTDPNCSLVSQAFLKAADSAEAGAKEVEAGNLEEGLKLMTAALERFPDDAQFLIMRGQTYLDNNRLEDACVDLTKARRIALINWYDSILSFICR